MVCRLLCNYWPCAELNLNAKGGGHGSYTAVNGRKSVFIPALPPSAICLPHRTGYKEATQDSENSKGRKNMCV